MHFISSACGLLLIGRQPRAPPAFCCAADGELASTSLRQRLREVNVDPALLREVGVIVGYKKAGKNRNSLKPNAQMEARAGVPMHNPFGARPFFVASADRPSSMPAEGLPEIAFIGRSNVGKSSLLNALVRLQRTQPSSDACAPFPTPFMRLMRCLVRLSLSVSHGRLASPLSPRFPTSQARRKS